MRNGLRGVACCGPALRTRVLLALIALAPVRAMADEGGVSIWLPGSFGSLAAVPQEPGLSLASVYYHTSLWAGTSVAAARAIERGEFTTVLTVGANAKLAAGADLALLIPTYVFATPVLGGQAAVSVTGVLGYSDTSLSGILAGTLGPFGLVRSVSGSSGLVSNGDAFPQASLRWNAGVNNFMVYAQAGVPVGAYDSERLANLGAGHWALDGGGGYTYFDTKTGRELSAVMGITYNFVNPSTDYQNGIDLHLDWGASQFLNERWHVGAVGYAYDQLTSDSRAGDHVGSFKSRVIGVGPQVGHLFSIADHQAHLNLKGYGEFDAMNRPSGWNLWLTSFSVALSRTTP